jgi:hypothetical protein
MTDFQPIPPFPPSFHCRFLQPSNLPYRGSRCLVSNHQASLSVHHQNHSISSDNAFIPRKSSISRLNSSTQQYVLSACYPSEKEPRLNQYTSHISQTIVCFFLACIEPRIYQAKPKIHHLMKITTSNWPVSLTAEVNRTF